MTWRTWYIMMGTGLAMVVGMIAYELVWGSG